MIKNINNQPISFLNDTDTCASPSAKYVQVVNKNEDNQFVQFEIGPCPDCTNVVNEGNITIGTGWSSNYVYDGSGGGGGSWEVLLTNVDPEWITISFFITSLSGSFEFRNDASIVATLNSPGTYTFTFLVSSMATLSFTPMTGNDTLVFNNSLSNDGLPSGCLLPTNYRFIIKDSDGNFITEIDKNISIEDNKMSLNINWVQYNLPDGCYYICLADPCVNTNNQNILNLTNGYSVGPVSSATCTAINDVIHYTSNSNSGAATVTMNNANLIDGLCYDLSYKVFAGEINSTRFRVKHGGNVSGWISSVGTYTFQHNAQTGVNFVFEIQSTHNDENIHELYIRDINLAVCASAVICDCCSNMFRLGTFDCSHRIVACNDKNGLGFSFANPSFSFSMRLISKLVRGSYKNERDSFQDSLGNKKTIHFKSRKSRELRIEPAVAEYVHDFISTLGGYDHIYIDNVEYFIDDDEYNVSYPSRNDIEAISTIKVSEKIQLVENKICGVGAATCFGNETGKPNCNC